MKNATRQPAGYKFVPTNPLVAGLENQSNLTVTENSALAYKSTQDYLLDFFGNAGVMRKREAADVNVLFSKALAQDTLLALKALFYIRDVRGGQGERKTFRTILNWLANNHSALVRKNITNVPFYGRWDDLYSLFGTPLETLTLETIAEQLSEDVKGMKANKSISLLAKWMKSENTSSPESVALARKTREFLGWSSKKYRKTLSALRRHIDVVEVKMCARQWGEIDFEHVPSKASLNYRKAFQKRAEKVYADFLGKVERGEAKINAATLYPYDILRTVVETAQTELSLKAANLQWKALPNYVEGDGKGLVIADTSGSMHGLPLYVAVSLAIYFAERNVGPFKDVFMTFSQTPCFHRLVGSNILEKWNNLDSSGWDMNTNLQAALDLILNTAIANKVAQKDMPSVLMIISDMEFDCASTQNDKTNFETMKEKFESFGYKFPKTLWWRVDSRNTNTPVKFTDNGTALVSGCSPSILKNLNNFVDPVSFMLNTLNDERYNKVVC